MATPLLRTKLYIPTPRPDLVPRPRLLEQLNAGSSCKLTLISAPAGFGKTTLLSNWIADCGLPVAWLSLEDGDNDLKRFMAYFVAALQTIESHVGKGILAGLQSPGAINVEIAMTTLLNEITEFPNDVVLILDDYHAIESQPIDKATTFTLDHLPSNMHLVIASRSDPSFSLSRLRASGQMTELRADDLRFTTDETATFLNQRMDLKLSPQNMAALEARTEGWIAGLQLAALSMQGFKQSSDVAGFLRQFTGSDRYIQDYLTDEVLQQRPKDTKDFLLQTSILNRLSGPLCNAVTKQKNSQAFLDSLEAANLFIMPLDNERRWYRYHHLFADMLRQRLHHQQPDVVDELHLRASSWYENNGLEIEALHHASAANDFERAARLVEGGGHPLYHRGEVTPVLNWLESLPTSLLDTRPSLWVMFAEVLMTTGQFAGAEEKYQIAEEALQDASPDPYTRDLLGRIANGNASLAIMRGQPERIIALSRRALDLLLPDNLAFRSAVSVSLGYAYQLQGDRAMASHSFTDAIEYSQASGNTIVTLLATIQLGNIQASENQLRQAIQTYKNILQMAGEQPIPYAGEAHLGLAWTLYQWNNLIEAQHHGLQSVQLARLIENPARLIASEVFLARLKLAQGDVTGAANILDEASQSVKRNQITSWLPKVTAAQILTLLYQGDLAGAAHLAQTHELPISQARVHLAHGDAAAALVALEPFHLQMKTKGWEDEILKVKVLQAVALHAQADTDQALELLGEALALAEPGGFIRIFVDEGEPMAHLLHEAATRGIMPDYTNKLLAAFEAEKLGDITPPPQPLVEPLSQRELEVLHLVAQGLSNREISERLFLALDTIKGYNRRIYGKLAVKNRTQAVNKAISLKILPPQ